MIEQTTMRRTGEDAATAVDAVHNIVLLEIIPHLQFLQAAQQIRLKSHRTSLHTLTAADTLRVVWCFGSLFIGACEDPAGNEQSALRFPLGSHRARAAGG